MPSRTRGSFVSEFWGALLLLGAATPTALGCQSQAGSRAAGTAEPSETAKQTEPSPVLSVTEASDSVLAEAGGAQTGGAANGEVTTDRARREPAKIVYRVAALGDSLTSAKVGSRYLKYLRAHCPESRFDDFGVGGDMVNQMRRRLGRDVLPEGASHAFTHLLVFGGVNDLYSDETAGRTFEKITLDLGHIYAAARARDLEVVAVTVAPWGGFKRYFNARRAQATLRLNDWIRAQQGKTVDRVVDAYALLSCGDPERLCPRFTPPFKDGLHFGDEGHRSLAKALFESAFADCQ